MRKPYEHDGQQLQRESQGTGVLPAKKSMEDVFLLLLPVRFLGYRNDKKGKAELFRRLTVHDT